MPAKIKSKSKPSGERQKLGPPPGIKLLRTLRGHEDTVYGLAFDPTGNTLASGSADHQVRLWQTASGKHLKTILGHEDSVVSVAFDPLGRRLASASDDGNVKIWDMATGKLIHTLNERRSLVKSVAFDSTGSKLASANFQGVVQIWDAASGNLLRTLEGHQGTIHSVVFDPKGEVLATGSSDQTVKLWKVVSGELLRTLEGHHGAIYSVVFDPKGEMLATGSSDQTVKLWDVASGKLLRTLEGHTAFIKCVTFSKDGIFLASKSSDDTVRIWRCDTWDLAAVIPEPSSKSWPPKIVFHPTRPLLASVGSEPYSTQLQSDRVIHLWGINVDILLGKAPGTKPLERAVHHTTAKIVLVGDHSVGKSGLGYRLVHGAFKEQASTHGQQFWVLPQLGKRRKDGTECEAILWDLAGQPDYRLIHALFLDDADLALVLFDASDIHDPLHGVSFWLNQLRIKRISDKSEAEDKQVGCPAILVGAQADRGAPTLTQAELETFCRQYGLSGYISTSAKDGRGLEKLVQTMKDLNLWEDKAATVTTITFKRIKDHVLELKENRAEKHVIVSLQELRQQLEQKETNWQFTEAEMMTAVGHLENYGYVKRLRTTKGEQRILLAPELLNNLAASFVLEARRNPKGLGSLEDRQLFAGEYPFRELDGLSPDEREILLDSAVLLFLEHHVCFRETDPLTSQSYLVFPELINLKKPMLENEEPTEDGMTYTVTGAVENVYASLVVLLGYTQTFTRTDQWRNQARYEVGAGLVCGFRQEVERDGELDFVLYFCRNVGQPVRTLFQGLFESFLARRNVTVVRYEPVACTKCGAALERAVVRSKLREGKIFAFCSDCGEKTHLPKTEEPIQLTHQEQAEVKAQRQAADQRSRFEQAIFRVQAYAKDQHIKAPECFISYAWGVPEHERWVEKNLATDLQKSGIQVVLDRWENNRAGKSVSRFVSRIADCKIVIPVGTPLYFDKFKNTVKSTGSIVASEVDLISQRLMGAETDKETVLPILLDGEKKTSLPPLMWDRVHRDFRTRRTYFTTAFDLILDLYRISHRDPAVADLRESLWGVELNSKTGENMKGSR
jgi:small GTP-binding protein